MALTIFLGFIYLPFVVLGGGLLAASLTNTSTEDPAAVVFFIPFGVACMLACFAVLAFWAHVGGNRALAPEEKRRWKRDLLVAFPLAAPRYWSRFK